MHAAFLLAVLIGVDQAGYPAASQKLATVIGVAPRPSAAAEGGGPTQTFSATISAIRQRSLDAADAIVKRARENPYRIPMLRSDYVWGSNEGAASARAYVDDQGSYSRNEAAINWDAPLVFLLASLSTRQARIAVFRAHGFPTIDAPPIPDKVLEEALAGFDVVSIDKLKEARLLVLPYGSAFPLDAWPEIRDFVKRGGDLVVLGGAPFHQPVIRTADGSWRLGVRSSAFAHEFLIGPAEPMSVVNLKTVLPDRLWSLPVEGAHTVWELTLRLGTHADAPNESGAQADREAVARPLVHLVDADGIPRACPLIEIDRLLGDDAGGRWIFATSDAPLSAAVVRTMVNLALEGASELTAMPVHASVNPGETPVVRVSAKNANVIVRDDSGQKIDDLSTANGVVEIRTPLRPGLYHVEVSAGGQVVNTGFWVRNDTLLASAPHMTVSRDWLRRDGKVFPIIGTTYMASDVHRHFLFEPNPHVWDRDFELMARLGINFVRTGLWTGWSRVDENALRAIDAYVQTAAKHNIIVSFTFFAFLPPSFGGVNPYLDPRAIEGQGKFITAVAQRFRGVGWIQYDLINEPSYAPPDALWTNRPIGDEWERRALADWVRAHPAATSRKEYDFVLFTQDVVAKWAAHLRDVLRTAVGDPLVTLGQDEGGTGLRSSQQLHAESVDYTSVHPWWQNDDVLSNGVFCKVPEKPLLFQETGLMRLEDVNGWPWRSPDLAASVLDRKYGDAFAARAAGVVQWAWNINPYMPIDNESVIGFFRPDGTAKPELDVVPRFAKFFREAAPWLDDFTPDPVVIVIPQSRLFMNRPAAMDGFRRIIRVLGERFGIVPAALSDLRLTAERLRHARLIIVPSVEFLTADAAEALLAAKRAGTKLLFTGAVVGDAYGEIPSALRELGVAGAGRPVRFHEMTSAGWATFDRNLQESLRAGATLPLEYAREDAPLVALLHDALAASGVQTYPSDGGVTVRLLEAPRAVLAVFVNDSAEDVQRRITIGGQQVNVMVAGGRSRLMLFERATGKLIAQSAR